MDDLDDFIEYDFVMGADTVECPECGADVPVSLFINDVAKCPACSARIERDK